MHIPLHELRTIYAEAPYAGIDSNVPYGTREGNAEDSQQRGAARRGFLASEDAWPHLEYPRLDQQTLRIAEQRYLQVLDGVASAEKSNETPESTVLYEQTARKLAEVYRHMEVLRLLGTTAVDRKELSCSRAANMSGELFGEPDGDTFQTLLAADIRVALTAQDSPDAEKTGVADEYLRLLGLTRGQAMSIAAAESGSKPAELHDTTIETIRGDLYELFPKLQSNMSHFAGRGDYVKPKEALPAFWAALGAFGLIAKGWKPRLIAGRYSADTSGANLEITYGEKRADFTSTSAVTTPVHEAIHALQHQNASEQSEPYRRTPLPGSTAFAEGLPVVLEQIISGVKRTPGIQYYMQLGLLKGMHLAEGEQCEQSFRNVHDIMWRRSALHAAGKLNSARLNELRSATYGAVTRTTRGNARDNRDISYFEGGHKATEWLNQTARLPKHIRLARLRWAFSGMFDPTNPEHVELYGGDPAQQYLNQQR